MSFSLTQDQYAEVIVNSSSVNIGTMAVQAAGVELTKMRARIYLNDVSTGNLRINIISEQSGVPITIASSEWVDISLIPNLSTYWVGWLRFDLAKNIQLDNLTNVTIEIEADNYSYVVDTNYIAILADLFDKSTLDIEFFEV